MKRTGILCLLVALAMLCACAKKPKAENNAPLPAEVPAAAQAAAEEPAPEESGGGAAEYVLADEKKEMANHSSILAWRIPCTEELGGLQSMELQRVKHE